jgi:magnesium transporter
MLAPDERVDGFRQLEPETAEHFFRELGAQAQAAILQRLPPWEQRLWLRLLPPDDAADVLQEVPNDERSELLDRLDAPTRREVAALLAYAEDAAGGLMSPRFARLRAEMTVDEAIRYLRRQAQGGAETIYYAYALDREQRLLGVVSFRELFGAAPDTRVLDIMRHDFVSVPEDMDQEAVSRVFAQHDLMAVPVIDADGRMKGIVTVDDIVDVVEEEATEDMQKLGGLEALEAPYLQTGFGSMLKKRGGWLAVLFVGETLTAVAMKNFEHSIAEAVVLTLFIPLIISSGGNSGSQAATLVIRAMALGEVRLRDFWRVLRRELGSGLLLGAFLALIGIAQVMLGHTLFHGYGDAPGRLAITVALSLIGVVTWGTVCGSMLPILLRRAGFDPASASAPAVATLVDVVGLIIYFSIGRAVLMGGLF